MKKKILLALLLIVVFTCLFCVMVNAEAMTRYIEFDVLLEGETEQQTVYLAPYDSDMYTVKVPMANDFYTDLDKTGTIDKTKIIKIDMSNSKAYGYNNNNIKQFIAASDNTPFANVKEIKLPNYPGDFKYVSNSLCKNWTSLTTIDFGSAYQTGDNCFEGCTAITELVIPEQITKMNNNSFKNCTGITSLSILGKTTVDNHVFNGCTSLANVTLAQVNNIGGSMFYGCSSLTEITIPETVTSIGSSAFMGTKLVSLHIPANVTSIGFQVLEDVTTFTTLTFAENSQLKTIGHRAFQRTNLTGDLVIPDSVTEIAYSAFASTDITSVNLPSGLTTLTSSIFSDCSSLESIELPENLTKIEGSAIKNCIALTELTIPDTVTSIGENALLGCTSVTLDIDFSSFTSIGKQAFKGYTGTIELLDISNATSIGESAFNGCTGIEGVTLSSALGRLESNTFAGCTGITSIHIPASVTYIGSNCFDSCTSLATVTFEMDGAKLESVGAHAFQKTAIEEIHFPNSLLRIAQSTFSGCSNLEMVNLGAAFVDFNAGNAGQPPFANGSTLKYIYLPATFNGVRDKVFTWNDNNANEYNKFYIDLTFFYTGTKDQAQAILNSAQGVNTYISSATLISAEDYAKAVADGTLVTGVTGAPARYFVYDYSACKAFYNNVHVDKAPTYDFLGQKYISDFYSYTGCDRCNVVTEKKEANPIFVSRGYSINENDKDSFMFDVVVDFEAMQAYYSTTGSTEKLSYGLALSGNTTLTSLINVDGTTVDERSVLKINFDNTEYTKIQIKVNNIKTEANKATKLFACMYVIENGAVKYIGDGVTTDIPKAVCYNDLVE